MHPIDRAESKGISMKIKIFAATLAFAAVPAYAAMGTTEIPTFAGQAAAAEAAKNSPPQTPEQWLARMTDFTRNMSAFRDPKVFVPWTNAVTEPGFYVAMSKGMMDPGGWLNMMNSMANPDVVRNYAQFLDPNITIKWVNAGADPAFYTALLTQLSDPGKLMRWGMLPLDPKVWDLTLSMFNPNTYIRWPMAMLDPRAWNLMGTIANPALYTGMAGALVNAQPDGSALNSWLSWRPAPAVQGAGSFSMWDPVAMLGNLAGWIPGLNQIQLPSLPNIGLPTFSAPTPSAAPAVSSPSAPAAPVASAPQAAAPVANMSAAAKPAVATAAAAPSAAPAATASAVSGAGAAVAPSAKPVAATQAPVATPVAAAAAPATAAAPAASGNKVTLAGDALFKTGKSRIKDLTKDGKARLDELAVKIKALGAVDQIKIVGHADSMGKPAENKKLSEARARSVKSYLVAKGVKPGVIITSGVGDAQPVVKCDMAQPKPQLVDCLAPNRRVEIEINAK
jgi:outer membrane protein OmpA-like peptidoglycan-associated protein